MFFTPTIYRHLARALAVLTLSATLAVTLAACGGSSGSAGDSAVSDSGSTTSRADASAQALATAPQSTDASMILAAPRLVDDAGNRWTVSGGVISLNGAVQSVTHRVIVLLYADGVIYQQNSDCLWWSWTNGAWLATAPPAASGVPACPALASDGKSTSPGLSVNATAQAGAASASGSMIVSDPHLVDGNGNSWTLSGGVISLNGSAQTITKQVIVLLYDSGVIYQQNARCLWWSWTDGAWLATSQPALAGLPACAGASSIANSSSSSSSSGGSGSGSGGTVSSSAASASGSMIPALTQLVDATGNIWSVSGGVIALNGSAQTITHKVILLLYYNGVISQENINCDWWSWTGGSSGGGWTSTAKPAAAGIPSCSSSASSAGSAGTSSGGVSTSSGGSQASGSVPAAAAEVGYNTRTYGPNVTLAANWFPWNFYGSKDPGTSAQNADGSVYFSGARNVNSAANIATAYQTQSGKKWVGTAFGGGAYFEAVLSFTGQGAGPYLNGGPTFWALDIEHTSQGPYNVSWPGMPNDSHGNPYDDFYEVDFMEYDVHEYSYQNGIGNWYGYPPTKSSGNPSHAVPGSAGSVLVPDGTNFAQYHTYGCLWVPATPSTQGYLKFYFDGVQTGDTFYWNWNNPNNPFPPTPVDNSTAMAGMDARHLFMMLGTGSSQPMTVQSATVWQASGANNLTE